MRLGQALTELFLGPKNPGDSLPRQGFGRSKELILEEWKQPTFGIMRLVRLLLMTISCLSPTLLVDSIVRSTNPAIVAVSRELYYFGRGALLVIFVFFRKEYEANWIVGITIYFVLDMVTHLAGQTFVWGKYSIDPRRSLILAILTYFELILCFALFYLHWNCLSWTNGPNPMEAVYFSIVTGTTVGFGDVHPVGSVGQKIAIIQLGAFLLFVVFFVSTFVTRIPLEVRTPTKNTP